MMGDPQQRSARGSGLRPSEYLFEPLLPPPATDVDTLPPFGPPCRSQRDVAPSTIHFQLSTQDKQSLARSRGLKL